MPQGFCDISVDHSYNLGSVLLKMKLNGLTLIAPFSVNDVDSLIHDLMAHRDMVKNGLAATSHHQMLETIHKAKQA